jgi:hypothetical protein
VKHLLSFVASVALLAPALARAEEPADVPEPVGRLTPPAGWRIDVGRSRGLERATDAVDHFGGAPVHVSAQHLYGPAPGGLLLVTEIATTMMPSDAAGAAAIELHGVKSGVEALGPSVKIATWQIRGDAASRVTEARLTWSDDSLGTTTIARTLFFAARGHLVRIEAACIIAADAGALRPPCEAAMATLEPLAPIAERVELVVPAVPPPAPTGSVDVAPPMPRGELSSGGPAMGEREGAMPVIMTVDPPKQQTEDRRPLYVGAGLLVLAAAYLWNRRKKQAEVTEPPPSDKPPAPPDDQEPA